MPSLTVPAGSAPLRLDAFLAQVLPRGSRRLAQQVIAAGAVRVNGRRARKGDPVGAGDVIEVAEAAYAPPALQPNPHLRVPILYEDADVIAVDKPAGLPTHALRFDETETVANFLLARYPELAAVGKSPLEAGVVHRLDTDTSGVLLAARTPEAYAALRRQFSARQVTKEYLALVAGDVAAPGEVRLPIAHDRRKPHLMRACTGPGQPGNARPALTYYRPRERFGDVTLLEIRIATGVMHQIRVHLASIGYPVLGDRLYGGVSAGTAAPRQLLHASRLGFRHPVSGEPMEVDSHVPADFLATLDRLRRTRPAPAHRGMVGRRPTPRARRAP